MLQEAWEVCTAILRMWWRMRKDRRAQRQRQQNEELFSSLLRRLSDLAAPWEEHLSRRTYRGRGIVVVRACIASGARRQRALSRG